MKLKKMIVFLVTIVFVVSGVVPNIIYATEGNDYNRDSTTTENVVQHSSLFESVYQKNLDKQVVTFVDENNNVITQVLDENRNIIVAEVYNTLENSFVTTSSDSSSVYLEITDEYGQSNLSVYSKTLVRVPRTIRGEWVYTGVAIPRAAIDNLTNLGVDAMVVGIGGLFGIGAAAVNQLLAFMGTGWSMGEMVGRALDTNGNGWVGLYKRSVREYPNGPVNYEYKTN
ncbi:hypothetical protein Q7W24_11045 [Streptococcus suis]|nr:hypothetical protein [Streptococcus suis]MDW8602479.1 hypothetical protein [Streptococcus suis]MDW8608472.1 hypothetical protein [Streptococcus suis]MDW8741385.1 hypothetical protein [Streptococcus suis]